MEQTRQWRAAPDRPKWVHKRTTRVRRIRAAAVTGAMVAVTLPTLSADGAVGDGRTIEVFTGSDLIALNGYPPTTKVKVEVVRQGFVVGYATKRTDFSGTIELNHVGAEAGDCFESPSSPDVQPRDTIRTTILSSGVRDTSVVRGVWIDDVEFGATTITVSGRVSTDGGAASVLPGTDVLELRINKDSAWDVTGRKDLREDIGASVHPDTGAWEHVLDVSASDSIEAAAASELMLEWSDGSALNPSELTIAEYGAPEPIEGCPPAATDPTAPQLLPAQDSGRAGDHVTNQATDLAFSGLAGTGAEGDPGPGNLVTLRVDGVAGPSVTAGEQGVYRFTGVNLPARATPYELHVRSQDSATIFTSASRLVTVDTTNPSVKVRSVGPSPLRLSGSQQLRAVYRIGEGATLQAWIEHLDPTTTVRTFAKRTQASGGPVEYVWNGKNRAGNDVQPGRYRMVLEVTDRAGNASLQRNSFRVTR
jgi:hypothetical protein